MNMHAKWANIFVKGLRSQESHFSKKQHPLPDRIAHLNSSLQIFLYYSQRQDECKRLSVGFLQASTQKILKDIPFTVLI